jgi:hypothetical protein
VSRAENPRPPRPQLPPRPRGPEGCQGRKGGQRMVVVVDVAAGEEGSSSSLGNNIQHTKPCLARHLASSINCSYQYVPGGIGSTIRIRTLANIALATYLRCTSFRWKSANWN